MNTKSIFALLVTLIFLSVCGQPIFSGEITPRSNPATPITQPTEVRSTPTPIQVDQMPAQQAAIQYVSKNYNIPADQIKVVSTEATTWPNGCLGVDIPGVLCTDVIVDGFNIKLEANGQQFEIHTNQDGASVIDAAEQLSTLGFVVSSIDRTIQVVNPNIPLGPTYNPALMVFSRPVAQFWARRMCSTLPTRRK